MTHAQHLSCPICGSPSTWLFHDYGQFRLLECGQCGVVFRDQTVVPDTQGMVRDIYTDEWVAMRDQYSLNTFQEHAQFYVQLLNMFRPNKGSLLEVGSGTGEFLYLAREAGWEVGGVEPSGASCAYARSRFGLDLINAMWDAVSPGAAPVFDVVAFWHVLEHMADPLQYLQSVKAFLKPDGLVMFAVPNRHSFTNEILGAQSPLLVEEDHLFHHTVASLQRLLNGAGLDPLTIFSREELHRFHMDLSAAAERKLSQYQNLTVPSAMSLLARLQSEFRGHELFCIARVG